MLLDCRATVDREGSRAHCPASEPSASLARSLELVSCIEDATAPPTIWFVDPNNVDAKTIYNAAVQVKGGSCPRNRVPPGIPRCACGSCSSCLAFLGGCGGPRTAPRREMRGRSCMSRRHSAECPESLG